MAFHALQEVIFCVVSQKAIHLIAVLKKDPGGQAENAQFGGQTRVLVYITEAKTDRIPGGRFLVEEVMNLANRTPGRGEFNKDKT